LVEVYLGDGTTDLDIRGKYFPSFSPHALPKLKLILDISTLMSWHYQNFSKKLAITP
jgi:hypothetical protein